MKTNEIDLHSNNSVISVIDQTGKVVAEKRLPVSLRGYFTCSWGVGPRTHRNDSGHCCLSAEGTLVL